MSRENGWRREFAIGCAALIAYGIIPLAAIGVAALMRRRRNKKTRKENLEDGGTYVEVDGRYYKVKIEVTDVEEA